MAEELKVTEEGGAEKELSNIGRLLEYEEQGYVFHGSPRKGIEIIEPRFTKDRRQGREFNTDNAVFGTKRTDEAIIYACVDRSAIPSKAERNKSWFVGSSPGDSHITARIPISWKPHVIKNLGYVYVFKKENFTLEKSWHVKSKKPVRPIDVVEVEFSDFEKLGGVVEWKEG